MYQFIHNGSVTSPKEFKAAGIYSGIKKKEKKDLALIFSALSCNAAGTFTLNKVKAAPIVISQEMIKNSQPVHAVLVNSGNANACTGDTGHQDALLSRNTCAEALGIAPSSVLISSTGVIGQKMPMNKLLNGIKSIVPQLTSTGGHDAAEAIMTTDLAQKSCAVECMLSQGKVTIGAIAKGSGMIMPNMATMLAFITTDAAVEQTLLQKLLFQAVKSSFNRISVDGDTSTNDMVVILANGASGITITENAADAEIFFAALKDLCVFLAKSIVSDGEGATKLITLKITGADSEADADLVGKAIANSPLVKTAIYGNDANWGRILSAVGNSGAKVTPSAVSIHFDTLPILLPDFSIQLDEEKAKTIMQKKEYSIAVNLNGGKASSTWWTCDFTEGYIKINADYRT